jgi:hypothetical protein
MARDLRNEFFLLFFPFFDDTTPHMVHPPPPPPPPSLRLNVHPAHAPAPAPAPAPASDLVCMSSNDPDTIDALFSTLAFVFKFLVKQIVMNFQVRKRNVP